jgi:hypothetical protein
MLPERSWQTAVGVKLAQAKQQAEKDKQQPVVTEHRNMQP